MGAGMRPAAAQQISACCVQRLDIQLVPCTDNFQEKIDGVITPACGTPIYPHLPCIVSGANPSSKGIVPRLPNNLHHHLQTGRYGYKDIGIRAIGIRSDMEMHKSEIPVPFFYFY